MTREQKYIGQMQRLGIYDEIFEPEIHNLCIMERDLQRLTKRWKADGYQTKTLSLDVKSDQTITTTLEQ